MVCVRSVTLLLLAFCLAGILTAQGPIPGPSVNIVSHDPYNQKQVEVDAGANPLNPSHILAGFIDYQTLASEDPAKSPTSSAWCGFSFSTNGGKTWKSGLVPGSPKDTSADGLASPISGSEKCGDPVIAWDTSGHVFYLGLAVLPGEITSLFVARFTDPDDGTGALKYDFTRLIDKGNPSSAGQVLDKPSILFVPDAASTDPTVGTLYACGSIFDGTIGSTFRTKVVCALSRDAGDTYTKANQGKVNGTINTNNGTWMAPAPNGGAYLFWRSFLGAESGYWFVKVAPDGSATTPRQAVGPLGFYPYDAPTRPDLARSNAFPTVAVDGDGRILLAFQAYSNAYGQMATSSSIGPRIFLTYSSDGGASWSTPQSVDFGGPAALQFMPTIAAGGGGMFQVLYYDGRNDGRPANLVDGSWLPTGKDRRFDLRVVQGRFNAAGVPEFSESIQVNQYKLSGGQIMDRLGCAPGACPAYLYPFLPVAAGGTAAFIGDYIALVPAVQWVRNPPNSSPAWRAAKEADDPSTFYALWVSTEDVAFPWNPSTGRPDIDADWTQFVPAGDPPTDCVNPKTRDSNVYFAAISPGLIAGWRGTSRRLDGGVPPQFVVTVENRSGGVGTFSLTINETNPEEDWSFRATPPSGAIPEDQNTIEIQILANSSVSLPVYYRAQPPITSFPASPVEVTIEGSGLKTRTTYSTSLQLNNLQLNNLQLNNLQLNNLQLNNFQPNNLQLNNISPSNLQLNNLQLNNLQLNNLQLNNLQLNNLQLNNSLVPDQDATWTVTGTGGVATSANAVTSVLNGQELLNAGNQFQLMIYQTQMNPGVVGCTSVLVPTDTILSNIAITNPGSNSQVNNLQLNNLQLNNLQLNNAALDDPQATNATFAVASDDEVKITLRSFKPESSSSQAQTALAQDSQPGLGDLSEPVTCTGTPGDECDRFGTVPFSAFNPDGTQVIGFNDTTPPVIIPTVTGTLGDNGWYTSDVTVTWRVLDPQSGIASSTGCGPTTLTQETGAAGTPVTCSATNGAGKFGSQSVTVKIDKTAPVIVPALSGTLGNNGWYTSDVTVTWSVTDPQSGVSSACEPTTLTTDTAGTTLTCSATNGAGLSGSESVTVKIDKTAPVITITTPADNADLLLNAAVAADYTCTDATSGVATCDGTVNRGANIPTNTLGERTFTIEATDQAGNTKSVAHRYYVVYKLLLTPPKSPAKLGSAIPLTWQLTDANGAIISNLLSLVTLAAVGPVPGGGCAVSLAGGIPLYSPATGATGGSDYRFIQSSQTYRFNWDSAYGTTAKGCYTLLFQFMGDPALPGFAELTPALPRTTTVQLN